MELGVYIKPLIKWWWLLLAATVVALISSFIVTMQQPEIYQSHSKLITGRTIFESNPTSGDLYLNQQLASFYVSIAQGETVRNAAMQALGIEWLPSYTARSVPNTQIIEIIVSDTIPERAQAVANVLANSLIAQSPTNTQQQQAREAFIDSQLNQLEQDITATQQEIAKKEEELGGLFSARQIADTQSAIAALNTKLTSLQSNYAALLSNSERGAVNTLTVLEAANLPTQPVGPNKMMIILLSGAIALVISVGAAYLLEYIDDTFKDPDEIYRKLDLPVVGFISAMEKGKYHGDYVAKHPRSAIAESFRALRTDLEFAAVDKPLKTILVASPGVAAGKTSIAINLAVVIAQGGKKVYLLDADLRKPSVHRSLGLPNRQGLSDAFRREKDIRDLAQFWQEGNIHVVTSGPLPPNPSELLSSKKMDLILQTIEREADVVIIDGPPFLVTDASILSAKSEGVLLVVRYGHTRKDEAASAVKQLQRTGARILGVVLNQIPRTGQEKYGVYRYYAGYYADTREDEEYVPQNGKIRLRRLFSKEPKKPVEED
jgi:capsular exopolysaccharide synthesis family protein